MKKTIISSGNIVTPAGVLKGSLIVEETRIADIIEETATIPVKSGTVDDIEIINAEGLYILPGLVDLHCDLLEQAIQPRKKVFVPTKLAIHAIQAQLLSAGITSMFHALSLSGEPGVRSNEMALQIVTDIADFRRSEFSRLRHFIHARYELYNQNGLPTLERMFTGGLVDLFSVMNHSAKYCRFDHYHEYKAYVEKNSILSGEDLELYARKQWDIGSDADPELEDRVIELAVKHCIPFATHDDDSPQKVAAYRLKGASMSEFPLNEETAKYVVDHDIYSIVGGPNLFRNKSHAGNLSARYAVHNKLANILCSDYYCFSLLASVFILYEEGMGLSEAVSFASLQPARAAGLVHRIGSLENGKEADLLLIRYQPGEQPFVEKAMVAGKWTFAF